MTKHLDVSSEDNKLDKSKPSNKRDASMSRLEEVKEVVEVIYEPAEVP
jgi:hypothetical protein